MKRRIWMIALVLSLLLCACAGEKRLPDNMHNVPEAYKMERGWEIHFAEAYVELFNRENPDTYVIYSDPSGYSFGERSAHIYGPGVEEYINSEYAQEGFEYTFPKEIFDVSLDHPIPREPETEVSFEDGVTMCMGQGVYPRSSEQTRLIDYTLECERRTESENDHSIYKYIDGEWTLIFSPPYVSLLMSKYLEPGEPRMFLVEASEYLGEGLYRVVHEDKYYAEFVVRADTGDVEISENAQRSCIAANVFYETGLPKNCWISDFSYIWWPAEGCSYSTDPDRPMGEMQLLIYCGDLRHLPNLVNSITDMRPNDDRAEVISPHEAAAAALPELFKFEEEMVITDVIYTLAYHNGDYSTVRPSWVFVVKEDEKYNDTGYDGVRIIVDARTGELVAGADA